MKLRDLFFFSLGCAVLVSFGMATMRKDEPKILVIGDSIAVGGFDGHPEQGVGWARFLPGNVTVIPENGRTSQYTLQHLDKWLVPADVILFSLVLWDSGSGTPLEEYRANMFSIAYILKETNARVFFLTGTPSYRRADWTPEVVARYNDVALAVMDELDIEVIDLGSFSANKRRLMLDDVHFSPQFSKAQAMFINSQFSSR